jgi:hypothetical protein
MKNNVIGAVLVFLMAMISGCTDSERSDTAKVTPKWDQDVTNWDEVKWD